jgi:hypothetical protein
VNKSLFCSIFAVSVLAVTDIGAQVTTVVAPPRPAEQAKVEAARKTQAQADSVARVTMTDMKAWVDSAAMAVASSSGDRAAPTGTVAARPDSATRPDSAAPVASESTVAVRDSAVVPDSAATAVAAAPAPQLPARASEGVPAPDTATPIPTVALIGGALLLIGAAALRQRRA